MLTGTLEIDQDKESMCVTAKHLRILAKKCAFTFMNFIGKRFGSVACPVACVGIPTVLGIEEKDRLHSQVQRQVRQFISYLLPLI